MTKGEPTNMELNEINLKQKIETLDKAIQRKEALSTEISQLEEEERILLHSLKSDFGENYEEEVHKLLKTLSSVEAILQSGAS